MRRLTAISLLFALSAVTAAGCMSGRMTGRHAPPSAPPARLSSYEYKLGPSDKIKVVVFGEENLSGEFLISATGTVSYPLIGEIPVQGQTLKQFQGALQEKLSHGYLRDPRVSAEVLNYRPFYILGEVNKPGEYPYMSDLTVLKAVATAQGFTYRANTRRVFIRHVGDTAEHQFKLDGATPVEPGDTVRVSERFF